MFDIAFSELLVIGVVALVVIGPERLPKVARMAGAWLGRLNRYVSQVKQDIDRDMQLEELRKLQAQMKETAQKYEVIADETGQELKREVDQVERVMQAMAATDGGLAMQEYAKIKTEQTAETQAGEQTGTAEDVKPDAAPAPALTDETPASDRQAASASPENFRSDLNEELAVDNMTPPEHKDSVQNT